MDHYAKQREAAAEVANLLERPLAEEQEVQSVGDFDPWEITPCIYGSYSSEFDDMAILVLENLLAKEVRGEGLAHEMFREMLCRQELCDYGTSPRVCFTTSDFAPLLPRLIERWKEYRAMQWGDA